LKDDVTIAQEAKLSPIVDIAAALGIAEGELETYGRDKAKVSLSILERLKDRPDGRLVLVTAITPTPAGEGKTTTTVGLGQALPKVGVKGVICLREPSLGPVFGVKGGAAGGGYSQVVPMADINLHFTGDIHAITSANNLLSALVDNHIHQGNELKLNPKRIIWKRCLDMNERALREIVVGLGPPGSGVTWTTCAPRGACACAICPTVGNSYSLITMRLRSPLKSSAETSALTACETEVVTATSSAGAWISDAKPERAASFRSTQNSHSAPFSSQPSSHSSAAARTRSESAPCEHELR